MSGSVAYPLLFSPCELAGRRLKNRIVHASISPRFGAQKGMHPSYLAYFSHRAKGGAAMLVTDPLGILPGQSTERIVAWNDSMAGDLARLAEAVEGEDCRLLAQIQDSGRGRHVPGRAHNAIGASPLPDDLSFTMPRPLTTGEVQAFIASAVQSAARIKRCGFSGVEISAGHGHLFHQFLSPRSNHRQDQYGGDLAGRCRLLIELCVALREACGRDFIVGLKLPGDDGFADSIPPSVAAQIAQHVVASVTVDYLTYAQGSHARTLEMHVPDDSAPRVTYRELVRTLRRATPGIPVMALGRITDPAEAEALLESGEAELVGLGRALIADPGWPRKAMQGRARDIRYCVSGNGCWKSINAGSSLVCDNNPRLARSDELDDRVVAPAPRRKRIVVVGAGIAGLEAAATAASRGHDVTLCGRSAEAGGKTRLHASIPLGESLSSIYDYQVVAAQRAGVRFELGRAVSADEIIARRPDEVVLATGARMTWPVCLPSYLEGEDLIPDLRTAVAALVERRPQRAEQQREPEPGCAVVFDMDHMEGTYAAAEYLRDRFARVVLLTPRYGIAEDTALVTRQRILRRFHERGIEVMTLVEPCFGPAFEKAARLDVVSVYGDVVAAIEEVAFFAYSTPRAPADELAAPLRAAGLPVHLIGDCKVARDVAAATGEGYAIGSKL